MEDFCKEGFLIGRYFLLVFLMKQKPVGLLFLCFHSDVVDVSRNCHLFVERVIFCLHGAQEWILPAMPL